MYRITLSSWYTFTNCSKTYFSSKNNIKKQPPEKFCEKGVLKNFTKFTGKHLCPSLFFNKLHA